jgi:hypothetical protein
MTQNLTVTKCCNPNTGVDSIELSNGDDYCISAASKRILFGHIAGERDFGFIRQYVQTMYFYKGFWCLGAQKLAEQYFKSKAANN